MKKTITFSCQNEVLSAEIIHSKDKQQPKVLFLHGAGTATKERVYYLAQELASSGVSSFTFDFSGHGNSTGNLHDSSITKRILEAQKALQFVDIAHLTVVGSSMGAHIAVQLLSYTEVENLVLFCPAFYGKGCENLPFNEQFSTFIRQPNSWENSSSFELLENFKGNLFVYIGSEDTIIPQRLIEKIDEVTKNVKEKKIIRIPEATHQLHQFLQHNHQLAKTIAINIATVTKSV